MSILITLVTFIYLFIYLLLLLLLPLFFWGGSVFLFVIPKCSELQNVHEIT